MGLSLFITRSIKHTSLNYWTAAWVSLAASLLALSLAFQFSISKPVWEQLFSLFYCFGEYGFGYLFYIGCSHYASGRRWARRDSLMLAGFAGFAVAITLFSPNPTIRFILHFILMATLFASSFRVVRRARQAKHSGLGLRVMSAALFLLAVNFSLYVLIFAMVFTRFFPFFRVYLGYSSICDMILQTLLGFGTIMVVMEDMRIEVEETNRELMRTKEKLEALARLDPLTEALNRHAFYSLIGEQRPAGLEDLPGCVVIIDIDNLKPINDQHGHTAGDNAIREVAHRLRSIIRADDMLFRWGGDEFMILLFRTDEPTVLARLDQLVLQQSAAAFSGGAIPLIFSHGIARFSGLGEIEQAIDRADSAMYASKQLRKSSLVSRE